MAEQNVSITRVVENCQSSPISVILAYQYKSRVTRLLLNTLNSQFGVAGAAISTVTEATPQDVLIVLLPTT